MSLKYVKEKITLRPVIKRHKTIEAFQASTSIYKTKTEPQARGETGAKPEAVDVLTYAKLTIKLSANKL